MQMWSVLQTNLAWTLFFPIEQRRKLAAKVKNLERNFLLTIPARQQEFSRYLNSDNGQRARVTRASCCRKESIEPIVISQVKHRITFMLTSISGWYLLMYVMYVFRTYMETQEHSQLLNAIRSTQILLQRYYILFFIINLTILLFVYY